MLWMSRKTGVCQNRRAVNILQNKNLRYSPLHGRNIKLNHKRFDIDYGYGVGALNSL
jgi:hypothetical protein